MAAQYAVLEVNAKVNHECQILEPDHSQTPESILMLFQISGSGKTMISDILVITGCTRVQALC